MLAPRLEGSVAPVTATAPLWEEESFVFFLFFIIIIVVVDISIRVVVVSAVSTRTAKASFPCRSCLLRVP